jgi:excisionase family DNA binding protein
MSGAKFLTYEEAADHLRMKIGTLRVMVHRKTIPHSRISARRVLFDVADLDAWIAARKVTP